ncbi:transglycosylase domain-containing protein [Streptomyces candidus]|uniref:Membrane peptidoglycan carboxypeptidase n=1 Tax=Streptomyces candidus TaxID=67283 RepID=A0A7X0HIS1_9ACTN|nr:transglycosylase domain-containing protein [Streptomyces candidus]MBB6436928.1 membrane peptidoglycan carboxypeptidase [Streptomyces candidus]GHH32283.1 penicillin-binding protein [Streptomyces candidus]
MSDEPQQQPGWSPRDPSVPAPDPASHPDDSEATDEAAGTGKKNKEKRPGRTGWRRLVPTWRMLLGAFLLVALLLCGAFVAGYTMVKIPAANDTATAQSNVYLYADGTPLARDGEVNRQNVRLDQIPKPVQRAVLAAEDRGFYGEPAVDPQAMVRAAWNTLTGKGKQSGSTITQQYVKNYYLGQEQTITRKVKEFFIAIKLNRESSKDDILEGYLNTSYFGRNAYGIQAAAQAYYGKDIEALGAPEGAYLASLLNSPNAYDVATHPENRGQALARWNYVLDGMVKEGWLKQADRAKIKFPQPQQAKPASGLSGQRGYIVQAVEDYLTDRNVIDEKTLSTGGYRITTTLEKPRQDAFVKAVTDKVMKKTDKDNKADRNVRVGGASIDPATGNVVALYGGIDYTKQYVSNATRRDFQVGSTFKPFVFTAAVENGSTTQAGAPITPNTMYDGTNKRPVEGSAIPFAPENEDDRSYGQITVRTATDRSVNTVYAQMAVDVGPKKVKDTAVALGIPENTPELNAYPSISLGVATASVLDMTEAYATLANHGKRGAHSLVTKISKNGTDLALPRQETKQVVSRTAADTTTSILQSVVDGGTGAAAKAVGRPAAGKTGTAEEDKAAWFAGYTPDLATVVAVMGADPDTAVQKPLYGALGQRRVNGGGAPAETWAQYTADALKGTEAKTFDLEIEAGAEAPVDPPPSREQPATPPQDGATGGDQDPDGDNGGTATDGGQQQGGQANTGGTDTTGGNPAGGTTGDDATTGDATTGATTDGGADATGGTATGGADTTGGIDNPVGGLLGGGDGGDGNTGGGNRRPAGNGNAPPN